MNLQNFFLPLLILLGISGFIFLCNIVQWNEDTAVDFEEHKELYFKVKVRQNEAFIPIKNDMVRLKKQPFDLVFILQEPMGILVNASFDPTSFEQTQNKININNIKGFEHTGMAEGLFNEDTQVAVFDNGPNYWFYEDYTTHRFNRVGRGEKRQVVGTRTITNILNVNLDDRPTLSIENMAENELYFVFCRAERGKDFNDRIELQKEVLKIIFEL